MSAAPSPGLAVRRLRSVADAEVEALAGVLVDCVDGGASVGFLPPLAPARARAFWRRVAAAVAADERALLVAEEDGAIVGTVQLVLAQPENQPHRADVSKLLVHRRARRRGVGETLMHAAEETAVGCGKSLLVLDTFTGSDAERLYARLGWVRVGTIPGYALLVPGSLGATTVFYKAL